MQQSMQTAKQQALARREQAARQAARQREQARLNRAAILIQLAVRCRLARDEAARRRFEKRTYLVVLEERARSWFAARRAILQPGYVSSPAAGVHPAAVMRERARVRKEREARVAEAALRASLRSMKLGSEQPAASGLRGNTSSRHRLRDQLSFAFIEPSRRSSQSHEPHQRALSPRKMPARRKVSFPQEEAATDDGLSDDVTGESTPVPYGAERSDTTGDAVEQTMDAVCAKLMGRVSIELALTC